MASLDISSSFSMLTLESIHHKGFGFAKNESGEKVFVSPKFVDELNTGKKVPAVVHKNEKGLFVKYLNNRINQTNEKWGDWQIGKSQVSLPNVLVTLQHQHINFGLQCWKCGNDILSTADVYKIHNGAVWTNHANFNGRFNNLSLGKSIQNKWKKTTRGVGVMSQVVHCGKCQNSIGSCFPEYIDEDTGKPEGPFPRCKITVCRQSGTDHYINQTVINSKSRVDAESMRLMFDPLKTSSMAPRKNDAMTYYAEQETQKLKKQTEYERSLNPANSSWQYDADETFDGGRGSIHIIEPQDIKEATHSREQSEFNFAAHQLIRLAGNNTKSITKVEVFDSPKVKNQWLEKREEFARRLNTTPNQVKSIWVFHGTDHKNMKPICENGFRVSRDSEVVNGTAYGHGVYAASGPDTPIQYSKKRGTTAAILALALIGVEGGSPPPGGNPAPGIDSWKPRGDWIVLAHEAQLLPTYIIHYS